MRFILIIIGCLLLVPGIIMSQDVMITGFPTGIGSSINQDFFKPYHEELQKVVDSLNKYPLALAVVTGGADGEQYQHLNDTKNPALALGRAHALRMYLINNFEFNHKQLVVSSQEQIPVTGNNRNVSVIVVKELVDLENRLINVEQNPNSSDIEARLKDLENRAPIEKHIIETKEVPQPFIEDCGLYVSGGVSTSPFGGIPVIGGGVTWKQNVFIETFYGHTFWKDNFLYDDEELDTKKRMIGGALIFYPTEDFPVAIVAGWVRVEEISDMYYEYVKLSEGPMLGLRMHLHDFVSIQAVYNPSRQREAGFDRSWADNDQFMLSVSLYSIIGGGK